MSTALLVPSSMAEMARFLTAPYQRGAEMLVLQLGVDAGNQTPVQAYDFSLYKVRYGSDPADPRYILHLEADLGLDALTVEVDYTVGGATATAVIEIPGNTLAGASYCVPLPAPVSTSLRIGTIRQKPAPLPGPAAANFRVTALLGNIAKLLWVIGGEKDLLRRQFKLVQRQRHRAESRAAALDLLGADLRVPRFPAREYSFAPATIALYHLNETDPAALTLSDETKRFGFPGHDAANSNADVGVAGKFDQAIRFPGAKGNGLVSIPDSPDFAIAAGSSFTAELFVNASAVSTAGTRILASKGKTDATGTLTASGWALALDTFRGFNNNLRWALSDGTAASAVAIFADLNLSDGRFHHVAGVVDGTLKRARLFVDGVETANADISALGALANTEPVRIGQGAAGNQFAGIVDEIRLSSVARTDFHPALGEGDEPYRKRLGIFERWLLPTPAAIIDTINDAVQVNADPQSFVLGETVRPIEAASSAVRFIPASIPAGTSLDATGNPLTKEAQVSGAPQDETDFDLAVLVKHTAPNVVYAGANTMQLVTRVALNRLVALLGAQPGNLLIDDAFDIAAPGLHPVGRGLTMRHSVLTSDALAVLAHRAHFDFVFNNGSAVEASVAAKEHLEIDIEPRPPANTPPPALDVLVGQNIELTVDPAPLPKAGQYRWTLIACGSASAHFVAHPADSPTLKTPITARPHIQLVADTPGPIAVKVEYVLNRIVHSGTRTIVMDIPSLPDLTSITSASEINRLENDVLGEPGPLVNTIYLITSALAAIDFGANPDNKRMQIGLEAPLIALAAAAPAGLKVAKAFDAAALDRHRTGLALLLEHTTLTPDALGILAHQAGFDFVRRQGADIFCAVAQGAKLQIVDSAALLPISGEFILGKTFPIEVRPAVPTTGNFSWSVTPQELGQASFDVPTRPKVILTPKTAGLAELTVPFIEPGAGELPYRFEVKLNATLEAANAKIPREDFDLIMNILNFFRPIGTEVVTDDIRKHVVEVEQDPLKAAPAYTFPIFEFRR